MKFYQGVDPNIGKPGFLSFHVLAWVFLMWTDLKRSKNYQNNPTGMELFLEHANKLPEQARNKEHWKAKQFFQISMDEMFKMFERWLDDRLFFLAGENKNS